MSFSITLYNNPDDPRKAVKNLGTGYVVNNVVPTEDCDVLNPTFILNYNANYANYNYVVAGAPFNRSYFIIDKKISIGKKIEISCAVDVLQTYWDQIKGNTVNVIRQENLKEPYLPDPEYKIFSDSAPYVIAPTASQISGMLANIDDPTEKPFIIAYVGGPRGGN